MLIQGCAFADCVFGAGMMNMEQGMLVSLLYFLPS